MIRWLALALVLEVFLHRLVPEAWVMSLFGADAGASVPLAVLVGAPMYLDGYAALPLVRGLMDLGMSFGAALGLMISGAAVSLYAAVAVAAVVRVRVFVLYVVLAMAGALRGGICGQRAARCDLAQPFNCRAAGASPRELEIGPVRDRIRCRGGMAVAVESIGTPVRYD